MKKYFSLNLFSLFGFISFLFWIWAIFQQAHYIRLDWSTGAELGLSFAFVIFLTFALIGNFYIFIFFIFSTVIEFFLRKKKNIKEFKTNLNEKIYTPLFYTGLVLTLFPFLFSLALVLIDEIS